VRGETTALAFFAADSASFSSILHPVSILSTLYNLNGTADMLPTAKRALQI
jgi:hypothetical protein